MIGKTYSVTAELHIFEEYTAPWTYLPIPFDKIPDVDPGGWGSIPVNATIGKTTWKTSLFPLPKKEGYFLPVKKQVLKIHNLRVGDKITVNYCAI